MGNSPPKDKPFEHGVRELLDKHSIEPWQARPLIKEKLERQAALARQSPLKEISVEDGLKYFSAHNSSTIQKEAFVKICEDLLGEHKVWTTPRDRDELPEIFDSMDFDGSGQLDRGEWAGGLSVFFKGNLVQCVHAVFGALDRNGDKQLSKQELGEYLRPVVKAMIPKEAAALQPQLSKQATERIYQEMDTDRKGGVTPDEMVEWTKRGGNLVNRLADIIEQEVYKIWLKSREQARSKDGSKTEASASAGLSGASQLRQGGPGPDQTWQGPGGSTAPGGWQPPTAGPWQQPGACQTMPPGAAQAGPFAQSMQTSAWQQQGPPGMPLDSWQQWPRGQVPPANGWQGLTGQPQPGWTQQSPSGQTLPWDGATQGYCQSQGPSDWQQQGYCPTQGLGPWQQTSMGATQPPGPWSQQNPPPDAKHKSLEHNYSYACCKWSFCGECDCSEQDDGPRPQVDNGPSPQADDGPSPQAGAPESKSEGGETKGRRSPLAGRAPRPQREGTVWYGQGWGDSSPEGGEVASLVAEGLDWRTELPESYPWNVPPPPPLARAAGRPPSLESQGAASSAGGGAGGDASGSAPGSTVPGESPGARLSSAPYTPCSAVGEVSPTTPERPGSPDFKSSGAYLPRYLSE